MPLRDEWRNVKKLYHFTDKKNLPSILKNGGLWSLASLKSKGIDIPKPGGNAWSRDEDARRGLDQYVHLCFTDSHPMEYVARNDGRAIDAVYLMIDISIINQPGVCFCPGVANKYDIPKLTLEEAAEVIDFEAIKFQQYELGQPEKCSRRRIVDKYEILVPNRVPLNQIRNFPNG